MKKILFIFLILSVVGCYAPRTGYIDYRDRRMYDWDPIYYTPGYIDPFFYRREPIIIYRDRYRYTPVPRQPQQPRRNNFAPSVPQPRGGSAPIRTFPKKEENREK
jgi:hypothetical protein